MTNYRKASVVVLSGGVGGARMARGFDGIAVDATVVVNVGDDARIHGVHVSADLDTVMYTLAGIEGELGWGRRNDTFHVMNELANLGVDTTFRIGDLDLATCMKRSAALAEGVPLSTITRDFTKAFGVRSTVLPVTDDPVRTRVRTTDGWLDFQEYFVIRQHQDRVQELDFAGAATAEVAPGVIEALTSAELVVIAPSNPPLSIWPMLAIPAITTAVADHPNVVAVSPLFGGRALKGPAAEVMASLGLQEGNRGVVESYRGMIDGLIVDTGDAVDADTLGLPVLVADTRVASPNDAARLATEILEWRT
ncbi:MAG: 2-phospho-L-lactate transferase [Acidimicrobiia bacterium]|nr:2-phospho-L-lactate transferase [Acidimicrobiia bacterium]